MNRKKAIAFHEMRILRWFLIIGLVFVFLYAVLLCSAVESNLMHINEGVGMIRNLETSGAVAAGSYFSISLVGTLRMAQPILVFVFAILTVIQFSELSKRKTEEFTHSLPFTRLELVMNKTLWGAGTIVFLCLLVGIVTFVIRGQYIDKIEKINLLSPQYASLFANETPWHTLRTLLLFGLTLLVTYFIFVVAHCLIRNVFVAGLAGVGMVLTPVHIAFFIDHSSTLKNPKSLGISGEMWRICNVFWGDLLCINVSDWFWYDPGIDRMVSYDNLTFPIMLLVAILLACLLLIWYYCEKKDLAKDRKLMPILWTRIVMSLGIGYGLGTTFVMMFSDANYMNFGSYVAGCSVVSLIVFVVSMLVLQCKVK